MIQFVELPTVTYGSIHLMQLGILVGIASQQQNIGTHALEFGTLMGETTVNIARILPRHTVLTCSLPSGVNPSLPFTESDLTFGKHVPRFTSDTIGRIVHFHCDSANLRIPEDAKLGFVFIDGAHSTDYVLNDFKKCEPFVVSGGVVVFHDYGIDGQGGISSVKKAVDSIIHEHPNWGWIYYVGRGIVWGTKP